jgi:hypothetical protein
MRYNTVKPEDFSFSGPRTHLTPGWKIRILTGIWIHRRIIIPGIVRRMVPDPTDLTLSTCPIDKSIAIIVSSDLRKSSCEQNKCA